MAPKITGGYYLKARCIKNSKIAHSPPYVRELWDYLLREANHKDQKYNGFTVKRGQVFKSYKEIRDDLCWYVGYRKMRYNENQMKKGMKALKKELMITTTKEPRGVLITICNYDFYQDPRNYERTNREPTKEPTKEPMENQSGPPINKNVKNEKNVIKKENKKRKKTSDKSLSPLFESVVNYLNEKAQRKYKPTTTKIQSLIKARLKEGFTEQDFKTVIDKKVEEWLGDDKMDKYLRPSTLFGTHFEEYLNQPSKKKPKPGLTKRMEHNLAVAERFLSRGD